MSLLLPDLRLRSLSSRSVPWRRLPFLPWCSPEMEPVLSLLLYAIISSPSPTGTAYSWISDENFLVPATKCSFRFILSFFGEKESILIITYHFFIADCTSSPLLVSFSEAAKASSVGANTVRGRCQTNGQPVLSRVASSLANHLTKLQLISWSRPELFRALTNLLKNK